MHNYGELIGSGAFSKVYRRGTSGVVTVVSRDPVKECMSLGWFPSSKLFPRITRVGCGIYKMKYYQRIISPKMQLNERSYAIYLQLRGIRDYPSDPKDRVGRLRRFFSQLPKRHKRVLNEAVDALCNYGDDICFEISPRNISRTPSGNLVLLDCFFFWSKLMEDK